MLSPEQMLQIQKDKALPLRFIEKFDLEWTEACKRLRDSEVDVIKRPDGLIRKE